MVSEGDAALSDDDDMGPSDEPSEVVSTGRAEANQREETMPSAGCWWCDRGRDMREAEADTVPLLAAAARNVDAESLQGGGGNIVMFPRPKNK
jgi:hypothetical protein